MATVVNSYTTGTAATETAPAGAVSVVITAVAGGGGGGCRNAGGGGGGGGSGSSVTHTVSCAAGDTCTYTVGVGGTKDSLTTTAGNGTSGGNTTVVAATGFAAFALITCNGGLAAVTTLGVAGGASGSGPGTHAAGIAGADSDPCSGPGDGGISVLSPNGDGGVGGASAAATANGVAGKIVFTYTTADTKLKSRYTNFSRMRAANY